MEGHRDGQAPIQGPLSSTSLSSVSQKQPVAIITLILIHCIKASIELDKVKEKERNRER